MVEFHSHNEAPAYMKPPLAASGAAAAVLLMSFPFEFPKRGDDVARTVFVEQYPPRPLASPGLSGHLGKRHPPGNEAAHFTCEVLEVATLVLNSASPIADDRAMPGNNALSWHMPQFLE